MWAAQSSPSFTAAAASFCCALSIHSPCIIYIHWSLSRFFLPPMWEWIIRGNRLLWSQWGNGKKKKIALCLTASCKKLQPKIKLPPILEPSRRKSCRWINFASGGCFHLVFLTLLYLTAGMCWHPHTLISRLQSRFPAARPSTQEREKKRREKEKTCTNSGGTLFVGCCCLAR